MKTQPLLSRFDLIVDEPGNIQHLRKLVIHLAVSGRLIDNIGDDRAPSELRKCIASKREALVKTGRIKKARALPPIDEAELPAGCRNVDRFERLENIAILEKGLTAIQSSNPGDYPLVVTAEERSSCDHHDFDGCAAIIPMVSSSGHGDASLKRLHYQEGKFALGNILCAAFPISDELITARFLFEYLTAFKEELLVSKMIGTANVSLTLGKIGEVPIPIVSPIAQRRVDELMTLCDRLGAAQAQRESRRDRLAASSLHSLSNDAPAANFRDRARFYLNHLPCLTTRAEHIKQLRQTILSLAIRGLLVPQDLNDESPGFLIERIAVERKRRIIGGLIKQPSALDLTGNEYQFDRPLPVNWAYSFIDDLSIKVTDGEHLTPHRTSSGRYLLSARNVTNEGINTSDVDFVPEEEYHRIRKRCDPDKGDVLISCSGSVGRVAVVDKDDAYVMVRSAALVKLDTSNINPHYVAYALRGELSQEQIRHYSKSTAQANLFIGAIRRLRLPMPPLAEQRRIVAKVDELMILCNQLETQLTTTQNEGRRLLEAVLHEALNPVKMAGAA
jgi:type I restriction enzyme, S subunit